jgi:hypothetical protein
VLFDAVQAGTRTPLVATIIPNAAMQAMPVEVEAASLQLAETTGAPAPHVHGVSDDSSFVGGPFFLTARIDGETIPRRVLRLVETGDGLGARLAYQCGEALARIHAADAGAAHPDLARSERPVEAALAGVRLLTEGLLQPSPTFSLAAGWLVGAETEGGQLVGKVRQHRDDLELASRDFDGMLHSEGVFDGHAEVGPHERADVVRPQSDLCLVDPARFVPHDVVGSRIE